jgi:hypothetical protein
VSSSGRFRHAVCCLAAAASLFCGTGHVNGQITRDNASSDAAGATTSAADIDGAWVTNATTCNAVYVKQGAKISFSETADLHGSGFIIEGNRIRGKVALCKIRDRKTSGDLVHIIAACSTDVAIEPVQFTLKPLGPGKIVRIFPGLPELNIEYSRCPFSQ